MRPRMESARRLAYTTLAAGFTLLSGCSLVTPHVKPTVPNNDLVVQSCRELTGLPAREPLKSDVTPNVATRQSVARAKDFPGNIDPVKVSLQVCGGIELAQGYFLAYRSAVNWNAGYRNATSAISIALGALLIREGLETSPSNDKIADFGVALAGLYGLSTQLTSKPREKVYLNGMKAMACAILEAQPMVIAASELQNLKPLFGDVVVARDGLLQALSDAGLGDLTDPDDAKYLKALSDAQNVISRTDEFAVQIAQASGEFAPLVNIIATEVSTQVVDTEASEQSLSDLLSGFGGRARGFVQSARPPKTGAGEAQSGNEKRLVAETKVAPALADLRARTYALSSTLAKIVSVAAVTSKVRACNDDLNHVFEVEPDDLSIVLEQGRSREFTVKTGEGMPTAQLAGEKVEAVELADIVAKNNAFHVRVTGKSPTGDSGPTLVITDGSGLQQKRIAIAVSAAQTTSPPAANNTNSANTAAAISDAEKQREITRINNAALVPEDTSDAEKASVKVLQCVVGANVDGTVGKNTRDAIKKFRKSTPTGAPEGIDEPLLREVRAALDGDKKDCGGAS